MIAIWHRFRSWWGNLRPGDQAIWLAMSVATIGGASFRLAYLRETLQFLADQGRDVIVAYGIMHGDIALVGPSTSVGSMFLGPLYYYFMAPFLWLAGYDPVGPAAAVAVLGILTIPVLYFVGSRLVGRAPALVATLLYASAPIVVEYTRFSWNPNPAPIVTLLLLYSTWKAWRGSAWWWVGVAAAVTILSQLHYVALLAAAPAGIYWLADIVRIWRSDTGRRKTFLLSAAASVGLVLASLLPLAVFNWRFNNTIVNGFLDFFNGDQESGGTNVPFGQSLLRIVRETQGRSLQALFEIWGKEWFSWYRQLNSSLLAGYVLIFILSLRSFWESRYRHGYVLLLASFAATAIGLSWYQSSVYFHYLSFFFPVAYLLTGLVVAQLVRRLKWLGLVLSGLLLSYIFWLSVRPENLIYLKPLGWQVDDVKRIADQVVAEVPAGKSYALTELSELRDYRGLVYRYFLLQSQHPPVALEDFADADYLVVIASSPREPGDVMSSPVYEIAAFPKNGYRIVENEDGPRVYLIQRQSVVE